MFLKDYFVGAGNSAGGADDFTLDTPTAPFRLNNSYYITDPYYSLKAADIDAQSTAVTFCLINRGHYNQRHATSNSIISF